MNTTITNIFEQYLIDEIENEYSKTIIQVKANIKLNKFGKYRTYEITYNLHITFYDDIDDLNLTYVYGFDAGYKYDEIVNNTYNNVSTVLTLINYFEKASDSLNNLWIDIEDHLSSK